MPSTVLAQVAKSCARIADEAYFESSAMQRNVVELGLHLAGLVDWRGRFSRFCPPFPPLAGCSLRSL